MPNMTLRRKANWESMSIKELNQILEQTHESLGRIKGRSHSRYQYWQNLYNARIAAINAELASRRMNTIPRKRQ